MSKSIYQVHKRKIWAGAGIAGLVALQYTPFNPLSSILSTPGVQNIEDRWSSGGGSKHHTPGSATRRGSSEDVQGNTEKHQGVGSESFNEHIGGQKPEVSIRTPIPVWVRARIWGNLVDQLLTLVCGKQPSGFDKAWNKTHYGQEKGK
ncbi:hypothetical protein MMC20_007906 [Loxospora ochrophaea]|nr:hypothetical protein [Loxospora ochrophaea]